MHRCRALLLLPALLGAGPALAADTADEALVAVKKVLKRTVADCETRWTKIRVVGYPDDWQVTVVIRESAAGEGPAKWRVGEGPPRALNDLGRALARGCP